MITQQPNVSPLGNRRTRTDLYRFFLLLSFSCGCLLKNQIDFPYLEASDGNIKLEVDRGQMLKLNGQNRMVPTSFLCQLVIRQNVGPDLVFGKIVQAYGRHWVMPNSFAAATRPCPAMIILEPLTRAGLVKPNVRMLSAI